MKMVTSELFKLPFILIFCCYVPSCPAQLSSQIVEQLFILSPKELQYRFPLFPSRIPFGLSTFSTSTAVLISFSQHQCIATATATGACRRSHQTTTISNNPSLATRFSETPIQVRATQVLSEEILQLQTAAPPPIAQDGKIEDSEVSISTTVEPNDTTLFG